MKKTVKAVQPYIHPGNLNFKQAPYEAWAKNGGQILSPHFPWRLFHGLAYRYELPELWKDRNNAVLMFVEPVSITFDTFPYYATHEIIPFIWDCWPCYYDKMEKWLKKHKVRTAIFTSKQEMEEMKTRCPNVTMKWCPEAVDSSVYKVGNNLKDRNIDLFEFGRGLDLNVNDHQLSVNFPTINHVKTLVDGKFLYTEEHLYDAMADAKITICLPRSVTHPQIAEGVETLTQRYWEAMLSRIVIVGHCPKELEELIGYNPVIEAPLNPPQGGRTANELILDILEHIEDYQELVDKNRETALRMGEWKLRIKGINQFLKTTIDMY